MEHIACEKLTLGKYLYYMEFVCARVESNDISVILYQLVMMIHEQLMEGLCI